MKKKIVSVMLATVLAATTLVGCGDKKDDKKAEPKTDDGKKTVDESQAPTTPDDGKATTDVEKMACPDTSSWTDDDKIYVYSWNDEFGKRLAWVTGSEIYGVNSGDEEYIEGKYPELAKYVEYVNLQCSGTDGSYQQGVEQAVADGKKYPSIIAADNDVAKYYTETEDTLSMSSIGITDGMYANAYQYTKDYATYNGELKALSWQATPGMFVYRTDIADAIWGQSDSAFVQSKVADWDTFFASCEEVKAAGYKMVAGPDEIKYACFDQQTQPWISADNKIQLDKSVEDFLNYSKKLYDGEYTNNASMWDAAWNAGYEGDVLGYFGCTWSLYWCMAFNESGETSKGKWNMCAGPVGYHWGGTYVMVMKDCPNTDLAAFLIYSLCCDDEIMYPMACATKDFVNNKAVIEKELANGDGATDILIDGINPLETWSKSVLNIDLSNATFLDSAIKDAITNASTAYNAGEIASVEDAIQSVVDKITGDYDYITQ